MLNLHFIDKNITIMNKITLLVLFALVALQSWAQAECTNTFSGSGSDSSGASIDITSDDLDCAGDEAISSFTISDFSAGYYCSTWYNYDLIIDDETIVSGGCQSDFVDVTIPTDFTSIQIVANDIDDYEDSISFSVDISTSFTLTEAPSCDATLEATEVVYFGEISWTEASGFPSSYNLTIGSTSGDNDILEETNVGDVTSYSLEDLGLEGDAEYYVTITPENSIGMATGCTEQMFSTFPEITNDECSGAIEVTVNQGTECTEVTSGSTVGATASDQEDDVTGTPNTDVWFSFIATASELEISLSNVVNQGGGTSTSTDMGMGIYDASAGCEALVLVDDSDPNTLTVSSLSVGDEYYIRVYGWYQSIQYNTFDLCVKGLPEPPANDECSGAIELTVNESTECTVVNSASTIGATASVLDSDEEDDITGTPNTDVWYSFTATEEVLEISLLNVVFESGAYSSTDMGMAIYDASGGCDGLVLVDDSDPNTLTIDDLNIGDEYYVRVYGWDSAIIYNSFDICIKGLPEPPANDACENATGFTAFPFEETIDASAATNNDGFVNVCSSGMNDGVWYTFEAASAGTVTIDVTEVDNWDPKLQVYSGSCGEFTCVDSADSGWSGMGESLSITVEADTEYYINVGQYSGYTDYSEGPFTITVDSEDVTLSADEFMHTTDFSYYPNPVNNNILNLSAQDNIQNVVVYNLVGQQVLAVQPNVNDYTLNMSSLKEGAYFVSVTIANATETVKILKK